VCQSHTGRLTAFWFLINRPKGWIIMNEWMLFRHIQTWLSWQGKPLSCSGEITNKMQPCNRIYYSTVHWRLNMFRAAHRSSSGALTVFAASGLHTHVVTGRSQFCVGTDYVRSPHTYVNQRLQIQLELLMMSGVPLERCWAFNERWNNKFYYKVASCWLFLLSLTTMHGSTNIKH
jgi:hypothetical protein